METNSVIFFRSEAYPDPPSKPVAAVWKIKTPENVGSLIRVLDNAVSLFEWLRKQLFS